MAQERGFEKVTYGVGTRLKRPPSPQLVEFFQQHFLAGVDDVAFDASIQVNLAHVAMLCEEAIITRRDASLLLTQFLELLAMGRERFPLDPNLGDLLPNIENYIIGRLGDDVGGKLHTGRSRGDYYVAVSRLKFRHRTVELLRSLLVFRTILLELAGQHVESLMPGYTHMQHAQPITLGHYFLAFVHETERDFARLRAALSRVNVSPLGLGIIGATSFPLNRPRVAALLGFEGLVRNGRDLSDRDYVLELASGSAIQMMHLHKLASDLYNWSTSEFGLVRVADEDCITSSMMPQKVNPVMIEAVRALTGSVYGELMSALSILKGSSANNTEVGEADAPGLRALITTREILDWLGAVLGRLQFDLDLMARRAGEYWTQATDLADVLVREAGLSFRQAHRIVGALVSLSYERGLRPAEVSTEMLDEVALQLLGRSLELPSSTLRRALDPWEGVKGRRLLGGPAPESVRPVIEEARVQWQADQDELAKLERRLAAARHELEEVARGLSHQI